MATEKTFTLWIEGISKYRRVVKRMTQRIDAVTLLAHWQDGRATTKPEELSSRFAYFIRARPGGRYVGIVYPMGSSDFHAFVLPAWQRRGIMSKELPKVLRMIRRRQSVQLCHNASPAGAALLRKLGYRFHHKEQYWLLWDDGKRKSAQVGNFPPRTIR